MSIDSFFTVGECVKKKKALYELKSGEREKHNKIMRVREDV
jgi:hypothetical protein